MIIVIIIMIIIFNKIEQYSRVYSVERRGIRITQLITQTSRIARIRKFKSFVL